MYPVAGVGNPFPGCPSAVADELKGAAGGATVIDAACLLALRELVRFRLPPACLIEAFFIRASLLNAFFVFVLVLVVDRLDGFMALVAVALSLALSLAFFLSIAPPSCFFNTFFRAPPQPHVPVTDDLDFILLCVYVYSII